MRKAAIAGAAAGATLLGAAVVYYLQEKATPGPNYRVLTSNGDLEIRIYSGMIVAETIVSGPRKEALSEGFKILADYIFAKSRDGEKLPMTAPVLQDSGNPLASDPPVFDDMVEGQWRVRFVMPEGRTIEDLPEPPEGIELVELGERRIGAAKFSGVADDDKLVANEDQLRGWLTRQGEKAGADPEYAFYNSPMIPPPLRRSEVLIPLG